MFNKNLYSTPYHEEDISKSKFLITGGAGFIGSNLVEYLLKYRAGHVRVLDNLSNGYYDNIKGFVGLPNFEFIEGDIRDLETCRKAVLGMNYVSHQAALGSVPRSIADPITSNEVNVSGFLNILLAAKESKSLIKMVYAASSSTYGDSSNLPKVEGCEGNPLSPYAVTKLVNELYADVFSRVYGCNSIGLRYFNVYGPKQNPNGAYAAVIPLFCKHILSGTSPVINGDGLTSRDFTFVENVIQANIKALLKKDCKEAGINGHRVYNVACGQSISLNDLLVKLEDISGVKVGRRYLDSRIGDVRHSLASIEKIVNDLEYCPNLDIIGCLRTTLFWYKDSSHEIYK